MRILLDVVYWLLMWTLCSVPLAVWFGFMLSRSTDEQTKPVSIHIWLPSEQRWIRWTAQ